MLDGSDEYGGRKIAVCMPAAPASAVCVSDSSRFVCHRRGSRYIRVDERVRPDLVTLPQHLPHQAGMGEDARADDEERRRDVMATQYGEDLRCPLRMGPVVKREGDRPLRRPSGARLDAGQIEDGTGLGELGQRVLRLRGGCRPADPMR